MTDTPGSDRRPSIHDVRPVPVRNVAQWLGGAVLVLFGALFIQIL